MASYADYAFDGIYTAPCPECGKDAIWMSLQFTTGSRYDVDRCTNAGCSLGGKSAAA